MEFKRNTENYNFSVEDVKAFLKNNSDSKIVAIPGVDSLIFYYDGKPISFIEKGKWKKFSRSYNETMKKFGLSEFFF